MMTRFIEHTGPIKQGPVISLCEGLNNTSIPEYTVGDACFDADGAVKFTDFRRAWRLENGLQPSNG